MPCTALSERWRARPARLGPEGLLDLADERPFALLHGEGRFAILGREPLALREDFALGSWEITREGALPPILPDFLGFASYEAGMRLEPLAGAPRAAALPLPEVAFALHRELFVHDRATGLLHEALREGLPALPAQAHTLGAGPFRARKVADTDTPEGYAAKVRELREGIAKGDVYQVNLTRQETWAWEGDLRELARRLLRANPAPHSGLVAGPGWAVLSSSPERLLKLEEGWLSTRPIKGTAPRGAAPEADAALAEALLASPKNRSELAMIVDLLRNDLAQVCLPGSVTTGDFPVLESYANVHHLVSEIRGRLAPGTDLQALMRALLPGGSVTGCPKLAAMRMIRRLEGCARQVYCGALGWLRHDLGQGDLALPIRTAWASEGLLRFGVGGGVVWGSDPEDEYAETLHKGRSLVQCLSS